MKSAALLLCAALGIAQTTLAQSETERRAGTVLKDCVDCPEIVVIPPGTFMMGTPIGSKEIDMNRGEGPQVKITIGYTFAMGRTEVTHGQFKAFVASTGHQVKNGCRVWDDSVGFNDDPEASWLNRRQPERVKDQHPVGCVSWLDARAYAAWLSSKTGQRYRLPTEAEWEYAARGGTTTSRFWGDATNPSCQWANVFDLSAAKRYPFPWYPATCNDGYADLAPVGKFKPNPFGLYDMIGNVWEWAEDCFAPAHEGRPTDGSAWFWESGCTLHANRGGGWLSAPERSRIAWPGRDPADKRNTQFGFRVARDLD